MNPVDVVMLTKNSDHLLRECLMSIYENVPVKRLVVIDASSTDQTLNIMREFNRKHGNVVIVTENGSRAKAREVGIQKVETEWFLFVDSDVILSKNWFEKAWKQVDNSVGAIWGLNIDVIPNVKSELFLKALGFVARECFNLRGGMHDTLIRTELVKGIRIPEQLHTYEDLFIVNWIKKKDHRVLIGDEVYCLHLRPREDWSLRESLSVATLELKCGLIYSHTFKYAFYYPFFVIYWFLQFMNKDAEASLSGKGQPKGIR